MDISEILYKNEKQTKRMEVISCLSLTFVCTLSLIIYRENLSIFGCLLFLSVIIFCLIRIYFNHTKILKELDYFNKNKVIKDV